MYYYYVFFYMLMHCVDIVLVFLLIRLIKTVFPSCGFATQDFGLQIFFTTIIMLKYKVLMY